MQNSKSQNNKFTEMTNKERRRKNMIKAFEIILTIAQFIPSIVICNIGIGLLISILINLISEIFTCIEKRKEISIYKLISIILESVLLHIIPFSFLLSFALMIIKIISIIVEKN